MVITIKVYLFILKSEKKLYAYTNNKDYAKRFLSERNKELFLLKIKKVDDDEFIEFSHTNHEKLLGEVPLFDGTPKDIFIVATSEEESNLFISCGEIYKSVELIKKDLDEFPFKKKWKKLVIEACKLSLSVENDNEICCEEYINTFALFYYLFKDTFVDSETAKYIKEEGEDYI